MADTPSQNFGPLPDTLTFGPFGPDGDIIVHIENLVLGCPPYVQNIGVPFVCAGEGYGSAVISGNAMFITTSTGYFTLRNGAGVATTYDDEVSPSTGSYCFWSSDNTGNISGSASEVRIEGLVSMDLSGVYVPGINLYLASTVISSFSFAPYPEANDIRFTNSPNLTSLDISANGDATRIEATVNALLTSVLTPVLSSATILNFSLCALDVTSVDAIANCADPSISGGLLELSGGTNAAPTAASLTNRNALLSNGWTVITN